MNASKLRIGATVAMALTGLCFAPSARAEAEAAKEAAENAAEAAEVGVPGVGGRVDLEDDAGAAAEVVEGLVEDLVEADDGGRGYASLRRRRLRAGLPKISSMRSR